MDAVIFRSLLLLSTVILTYGIITEQPINYEFCQCPCAKAEKLEVEAYFPTQANCVYLQNHFAKGPMFISDELVGGKRMIYHDITHQKPPHRRRYPHNAFWKVFYPWKNYTGDPEKAPQVIQNILTLEFVTWTEYVLTQSNREVLCIPKLTSYALWEWFIADLHCYRIGNYITKEYLEADAYLTHAWNEGLVFTDLMKRFRSSLHMDKFGWYIRGCYY